MHNKNAHKYIGSEREKRCTKKKRIMWNKIFRRGESIRLNDFHAKVSPFARVTKECEDQSLSDNMFEKIVGEKKKTVTHEINNNRFLRGGVWLFCLKNNFRCLNNTTLIFTTFKHRYWNKITKRASHINKIKIYCCYNLTNCRA